MAHVPLQRHHQKPQAVRRHLHLGTTQPKFRCTSVPPSTFTQRLPHAQARFQAREVKHKLAVQPQHVEYFTYLLWCAALSVVWV